MAGKKLAKYWWVFLLVAVLLLRLPSLFEPFTYGDEGIYLTLGQAARKGLVWYRDIHDNKPPMLYLVAAIAGDFSTYRLLSLAWSLVTIFAFYKLAKLVLVKRKGVITATFAFALFTSLHSFEGNVANAENFMLLPTILGFYLLLKKPLKATSWLLIGGLFGVATLFKVPAAFDLVAAWIFLLLVKQGKNLKDFLCQSVWLISGFLGMICLTGLYYASEGAFQAYLTAAFFQNIPYLSSWLGDKPQVGGLPLGLLLRSFLILTLIVWLWRKRVSLAIKLILLWFAFSLFAALLSSRPYPHYLIQVLPALSLAFGFFSAKEKKAKILPSALFFILLLAFLSFKFWYYPNLPYYFNFYRFVLTQDKADYFRRFDNQALALYQVADYLATHTQKEERIFIWGTQPSIYALARRLPVGRYAASYHIVDFNGYEETIKALQEQQPNYITVSGDEKRPFPQMETLLQQDYSLETEIGDFQIFHRVLQQGIISTT